MGVDAGSQPDKAQAVGRLRLELALVFTRQRPGHGHNFNQAKPWPWWSVIELGAGAALGFNQARRWPWSPIQIGKPWPWPPLQPIQPLAAGGLVLVPNQGKPRLWPGLRLELALVFTRQRPGPGHRFNSAKPWPWEPVIELA